jgi:DNA-binding NarL/FixJ family response regulator
VIRLLVVDDHALFRAGLVSLLGEMPGYQVVGEAQDGKSAVEAALRLRPDVILLDVNMPGMSGVEAVAAIRKTTLKSRILMLTISKNEEDLFGAITAGADGYLLKNAEIDELCKSIQLVHDGMSVLSPQVTRQVLKKVSVDRSPENELSSREMEVLECLAQGKTTLQIATELFISENTVKTHVRHILDKLEAANRAEAVSKGLQIGLLKSSDRDEI